MLQITEDLNSERESYNDLLMGDILKDSNFQLHVQDQQPENLKGYSPVKNKKKSPKKNNPATPAKSPNHQPQRDNLNIMTDFDPLVFLNSEDLNSEDQEERIHCHQANMHLQAAKQSVNKTSAASSKEMEDAKKILYEVQNHQSISTTDLLQQQFLAKSTAKEARPVTKFLNGSPFEFRNIIARFEQAVDNPACHQSSSCSRWSTGSRAQREKSSNVIWRIEMLKSPTPRQDPN